MNAPCPDCQAELPPTARFCPNCGRRVAEPPTAIGGGERRPVAILFADLAGFTGLASQMDAEDVRRLLGRYFEVVDGIIAKFGGTVDKHIGDATMAVFGAPVARGNDIERAVRAACEIQSAMEPLSSEFGRHLRTHIGIACGDVVAGSVGSAVRADYTMTGDAVNLASRLEELAGPGETIVSDDVRRALAANLEAEPRGTLEVRGFARPMPVWRALAVTAAAPERRALVGRAEERARFDRALAAMHEDGRGCAWLVRGEPGVGKSRLAAALMEHAAAAGLECHTANVLDFGATQESGAAQVLTRSLLELDAAGAPAARRAALEAAHAAGRIAAEHKPFLADLLLLPPAPGSPYESMEPATRAAGRIAAFAALASSAAKARPLALLIEDVHWADAALVEMLAALRTLTSSQPVALVATTRRDGDPLESRWPPEGAERVELGPLGHDEARALARSFGDFASDLVERCVERAQGNPLFLAQLMHAGAGGEGLPATIQSVVLAQLDRLGPREKRALQAASVAGQRFDPALLAHLLGGIGDPLVVARERDLVRTAADGMTFSHALIRDGAYASLLVSDRRELHRRAATWFAGRDPILRAEHLERAEDSAAAAAFLEAARVEAAALHPDAALSLACRGAARAVPGEEACALAMLEGELARDLGQASVAVEAFRRAERHASTDLARCRAALGVAEAHRLTSATDAGLAVLDAVQPLLEGLDAARERSRADYLRGCLLFARGDLEHCATSHRRALEYARQAGDALCEAQAFSGLADVQYAEGKLRSAHASFARCVELGERQRAFRLALPNRNMMGLLGSFLGEIDEAVAALAEARERAREIGHRVAEVMADECAGLVLVGAGRDDEAKPILERSLALARAIDSRRFAAIILALLGLIALRAGDRDQARARLDESDAMNEAIGPRFARPLVLGIRARLADSAAERERACAEAETLLAEGALSHNHLCFREHAIDACLAAGDAEGVLRHASALEAYASVEPTPWSDFIVARARALARARRDPDELIRLAERAAELGLRAAIPALQAGLDPA